MSCGEERHLETDEGICETERDVFAVCIRSEASDNAKCHKGRDEDRLPKREEENPFYTKEFGNRPLSRWVESC